MNKADETLKKALDTLLSNQNIAQTIANDPIQFAHQYKSAKDKELAAIFASFLAFGRVSLFLPVIRRWMKLCDDRGGPRQAVEKFSSDDIPAFSTLSYRWNKHPDFVLAMFTFQRLFTEYDTVGKLVESLYDPEQHVEKTQRHLCYYQAHQVVQHLTQGLKAKKDCD